MVVFVGCTLCERPLFQTVKLNNLREGIHLFDSVRLEYKSCKRLCAFDAVVVLLRNWARGLIWHVLRPTSIWTSLALLTFQWLTDLSEESLWIKKLEWGRGCSIQYCGLQWSVVHLARIIGVDNNQNAKTAFVLPSLVLIEDVVQLLRMFLRARAINRADFYQ